MSGKNIYILCALFNGGFALFHLFFWKLFHWRKELDSLTPINRAIMQVMNIHLIFVFLFFAFVTGYWEMETVKQPIGRSLVWFIAIFWWIRAINQLVFFSRTRIVSWIFFLIFLLGGLLHILFINAWL
jgi:hypothetical protein